MLSGRNVRSSQDGLRELRAALDSPMGRRLHGFRAALLGDGWGGAHMEPSAASLSFQGASGYAFFYEEPRHYIEHNFTQPLDHFGSAADVTFPQRYFLATRWYEAGAAQRGCTRDGRAIVPVILYDGGETSINNRRQVLEHGIVKILAQATGGIGIVLEHRYYGTSVPNRTALGAGCDWGVDQLRWLNNRQSLEDSARFVRRLHVPGIPRDAELRVIYYGGSYAGARAAFMRKEYPDLIHGAVCSSGVVAATVEMPEYFYPIARGSDPACIQGIQRAVAAVDRVIAPDPPHGSHQTRVNASAAAAVLRLFGAETLALDDFANLLAFPLGTFQSRSWRDDGAETAWGSFCDAITNATLARAVVAANPHLAQSGVDLPREALSYSHYIRAHVVNACTEKNKTVGECFETNAASFRSDGGMLTDGKAWQFQVCTEWGYLQTAPPPADVTAVPPRSAGPKLVSARLDADSQAALCRTGFTPGTHFAMPPTPQVHKTNQYGALHLAVDRLAIIDGQYDPWRPMTVHSEEYAYGGTRLDTLDRPFKLIPECWHHCDSDGYSDPDAEPPRIRDIHTEQVAFVRHWLGQERGRGEGGGR
ncbi:hypothetical protein MSPP1_001962 [Malassezia sp. CBS 17886]|nr:hypothetical protein MSPP1_001962 [Malassezia sp. CBS 17886]